MRQSEIRLALEASLCWLGVFGIQISRYPENAECDEASAAVLSTHRRRAAEPVFSA